MKKQNKNIRKKSANYLNSKALSGFLWVCRVIALLELSGDPCSKIES